MIEGIGARPDNEENEEQCQNHQRNPQFGIEEGEPPGDVDEKHGDKQHRQLESHRQARGQPQRDKDTAHKVGESDIVYGPPSVDLDMGVFNQLPQRFRVGEKHSAFQENNDTQTNPDNVKPTWVVGIAPVFDFLDEIHNLASFPVTKQKSPLFV